MLCISFALVPDAMASGPQSKLETELIEIHPVGHSSLSTRTHSFCVEIADDPHEWTKGLMFRTEMGKQSGMLFLHPDSKQRTMWMKNTSLPLDMFFIDEKGTIVMIVEHTTPFSHDVIGSLRPVTAVLELNAGSAKQYGISKGDSVHHAAFGQKLSQSCTQ